MASVGVIAAIWSMLLVSPIASVPAAPSPATSVTSVAVLHRSDFNDGTAADSKSNFLAGPSEYQFHVLRELIPCMS